MQLSRYFRIIVALIFCGLASANSNNVATDANVQKAVAGNTEFALSLYGELKDSSQSNLFFSPYSVSSCLAMTYAGASGDNQKQMESALHFSLPNQQLQQTFGLLQKQLMQEEKSRGYQLLIANALWTQKGESFLKNFLDLTKNYEAGFNQLDFINDTEKSRQIINSWVAQKTKDKIQNLIPEGTLNINTKLVLTNAIYFKGEWKIQFSKGKTKSDDFIVSENQKVKVPLMHVEENYKYWMEPNFRAIALPYKSDDLSMAVILPNKAGDLAKIEKNLTKEMLDTLFSKMFSTKVQVYLPKFKMTWGISLNKALMDMGMSDAFSKNADFSGMNGKKDLYISDVFHKAFIEVNEDGTEAAAATAVHIGLKAAHREPFIFRADHPFIFIIKDNRSGSILFMGRLMNPNE